MQLRPDIHTALFIALVTLLTIYVWHSVGGFLASSPTTESVGKGMLAMS